MRIIVGKSPVNIGDRNSKGITMVGSYGPSAPFGPTVIGTPYTVPAARKAVLNWVHVYNIRITAATTAATRYMTLAAKLGGAGGYVNVVTAEDDINNAVGNAKDVSGSPGLVMQAGDSIEFIGLDSSTLGTTTGLGEAVLTEYDA